MDRSSFILANDILDKTLRGSNNQLVLLGNKQDLEHQREVKLVTFVLTRFNFLLLIAIIRRVTQKDSDSLHFKPFMNKFMHVFNFLNHEFANILNVCLE